MFFFFCLPFFFFFFTAQAALVNVTIDDSAGDPLSGARVAYTPPDAWNSQNECQDCAVHPDVAQLEAGTWHESTFSVDSATTKYPDVPLTASVSFNGSAVYVFCALTNAASDMSFYIDGVVAGTFVQPALASDSATFNYRVPVFASARLPARQHTLTIQNGLQGGPRALLVLDSIVYTRDDSTQPSALPAAGAGATPKLRDANVAAAVVIVLVFVAFSGGLAIFLLRRRRRRRAVYAQYMPEGAVRAFPTFLGPARPGTPAHPGTPGLAPPQPAYAGGRPAPPSTSWWVGRDQKSSYRPYDDLDQAQGRLQRPQGWERPTAQV
ncbi:hypothetical protein B0H15DRAFT_814384 [Mycena belliarum]|uniref:Uncharacterized protein n=1 Tax=Mycena belliarum TaxID=1033014 RepID=A0AAD6UH38_9AGAR|nr:hypothetical protein B0H15DRAFT_814384 [Mycena belliae]